MLGSSFRARASASPGWRVLGRSIPFAPATAEAAVSSASDLLFWHEGHSVFFHAISCRKEVFVGRLGRYRRLQLDLGLRAPFGEENAGPSRAFSIVCLGLLGSMAFCGSTPASTSFAARREMSSFWRLPEPLLEPSACGLALVTALGTLCRLFGWFLSPCSSMN